MEKLSPEARASRKKTIWLLAEAALFFGGLPMFLILYFRWMFGGEFEEAKRGRVQGDLEHLQVMTRMFQSRHHRLPTSEEGLAVFLRRPSTWPPDENWRQIIDEPLRDPWSREYRYETMPEVQGYRLRSLGPDEDSPDDDITMTWPEQTAKERASAQYYRESAGR